jgi:hypothetical protein
MKLLEVVKSDREGKKYKAVFETDTGRSKTTHFGATGYNDYTMTSGKKEDKEMRDRYRTRHEKDLKSNDPSKAGFLSYYTLWGDSTSFSKNVSAFKNKFNL